jgi:hypothetical protein
VSCDAAEKEHCTGLLSLVSSKRIAPKRRLLTLGTATRFDVAPGASAKVNVNVSKGAAKIVRRKRSIQVNATATARDAAGNRGTATAVLTLSAARARRQNSARKDNATGRAATLVRARTAR